MLESSNFVERLLYQSEGEGLDFKKEQYAFDGATDEQKSELLKDVLAFANSWRQGDAYIVIGVQAMVGDRHILVGTEKHFDDAQLQQFVNSKTNRKIKLSYEVHLCEGKKIGIIRISEQERPIYAKARFGKVEKEIVYYRLGSSTAVAKPEDIARMGRDSVPNRQQPILMLQFADHQSRTDLGTCLDLWSIAYEGGATQLPDASEKKGNLLFEPLNLSQEVNREYWRDKEEYLRTRALLKPVCFVIRNQSGSLAEGVRVEVVGSSTDGISILNEDDLPRKPAYRRFDNLSRNLRIGPQSRQGPKTEVEHYGNGWTLTVNFGNVQPKSHVWTMEPFYIGSASRTCLELEASIYADNLPEPQKTTLTIRFVIEKKPALTLDVLKGVPPFEQ